MFVFLHRLFVVLDKVHKLIFKYIIVTLFTNSITETQKMSQMKKILIK